MPHPATKPLLIGIAILFGLTACDSGGGGAAEPEVRDGKIVINSVRDLRRIGDDASFPLDADYLLVENVDASGTSDLNGEKGFRPIASSGNAFRGTFDGNGFTISGLTINRPDADSVGLFASTRGASLTNVELVETNVSGNGMVGGLVGTGSATEISDSSVEGVLEATGSAVGGVAGAWEGGSITGVSADVSVVSEGEYTGGLVGQNKAGTIRSSVANGDVDGRNFVGGLIGFNEEPRIGRAAVVQCLATGDVSGTDRIGGLIGSALETSIRRSFARGEVTADAERVSNVGGLLGTGRLKTAVIDASAEGDVSGSFNVGGLVGSLSSNSDLEDPSRIDESVARGTVTGTSKVGGLVGLLDRARVSGSFATDSVSGENLVGGLVGASITSQVLRSFALGSVDGTEKIGGLIGQVDFPPRFTETVRLAETYAAGRVSGTSAVGGLVGRSRSSGGQTSANYWDTRSTMQETAVGSGGTEDITAIGLTPREMQGSFARENMEGFDFEETWQATEDYPTLWWGTP